MTDYDFFPFKHLIYPKSQSFPLGKRNAEVAIPHSSIGSGATTLPNCLHKLAAASKPKLSPLSFSSARIAAQPRLHFSPRFKGTDFYLFSNSTDWQLLVAVFAHAIDEHTASFFFFMQTDFSHCEKLSFRYRAKV